ncbi:SDR family oxidoreductase [Parashewanella tropica]|uniref:SDR family oxidoreductase n=1 Tax=Parashewanella tropica TaxID=2547970 RepID=UPI0010592FE4|nr:SDR family oxidoreductase [Parashewanella tropica]
MNQKVTIIGCGWFGFPLAKHLLELGFQVSASKREASSLESLKDEGIKAFTLDLEQELTGTVETIAPFLQSEYLIVTVPPRLRRQTSSTFLSQLKKLMQIIDVEQYNKIVFTSSTSVYPDIDKIMVEEDATSHSESSETMLAAEDLFLKHNNGYVLRFSGLMGPQRPPGRFFAGKTQIPAGDKVVNLVHQTDCIQAMVSLLTADSASKVYNVCSPHHPSRSEFYTQATRELGVELPEFLNDGVHGKEVSGSKISCELGFSYQFDDLFVALKAC